MNTTSFVAALVALSLPAGAQIVTEIPAMTVPFARIDMDSVGPVGNTTLAALRAAGGNAPLGDLVLTPSTAANGFYNTNPELGRALARGSNNQLVLVDPLNNFNAFDARIVLQLPSFEFGLAIGDWLEGMVLQFFYQGVLVDTFLTSNYTTADAKFFHSGLPFDEIRVSASRPEGNWVIPQLYLQNVVSWTPFGSGCTGSNGVPTLRLVSAPVNGGSYDVDVVDMPAAGGAFLMTLGFSDTNFPGFGALPFDMGPLGAPGCAILCDVVTTALQFHTSGTGRYSLPIPAGQILVGLEFFNQAFVADPGVNVLGVTTSNGARAVIQ